LNSFPLGNEERGGGLAEEKRGTSKEGGTTRANITSKNKSKGNINKNGMVKEKIIVCFTPGGGEGGGVKPDRGGICTQVKKRCRDVQQNAEIFLKADIGGEKVGVGGPEILG